MAYAVTARYTAHEGKQDRLLEVLEEMTAPSRAEPGCLFYQAHSSLDEPLVFLLYEQYVDEAGYEAHQETPHFKRLLKEEAIPKLLAKRERAFYTTIGDDRGGPSA
jgi:quinol monooxygenase YgiN